MITSPISRYRQIAGDKCVVGSETFFLPMEVECPVMAPGDIDLMAFKASEVVNKSITFNFTQGQVIIYLPISIYIYIYTLTSIYSSIINPFVHLSIYQSIHLSIHPSIHSSINLSIHVAIHPSIHLSIHPSIHSFIH